MLGYGAKVIVKLLAIPKVVVVLDCEYILSPSCILAFWLRLPDSDYRHDHIIMTVNEFEVVSDAEIPRQVLAVSGSHFANNR